MQIKRISLLGFKSFVDPADLIIEPGLTGVVGPNGCGKSNLLEALRWVMGETSYKSMRGSAMDDVIFSGTQHRPSRNVAQVTLTLDNSRRTAPAEFNDRDEVEICRTIERECGSAYRINGRETRARDVRLLFEDAATGARSNALVRQGQIGEIVNAKPTMRRRVLEDAAGIAGLHSRRHEAELRLTAADDNLARLLDILAQYSTQINGLKRQARQAKRYREISSDMRRAEALQHHFAWHAAQELVTASETELTDSVREVEEATRAEAIAIRRHAEASEAVTPLRTAEVTRAAVLQRLRSEHDALDREFARIETRTAELQQLRNQLLHDKQREEALIKETETVLANLANEASQLAGEDKHAAEHQTSADERCTQAKLQLDAAEQQLSLQTTRRAEYLAQHAHLERVVKDCTGSVEKLGLSLLAIGSQRDDLARNAPQIDRIKQLDSRSADLEVRVVEIEREAANIEQRHRDAKEAEAKAREACAKAELALSDIDTECRTLTKLLRPTDASDWVAVVDQVRVAPGFERAFAAALGDDLDASTDQQAPVRWGENTGHCEEPKLPEGATAMDQVVKAPKQLLLRLRQIGIIDPSLGETLQKQLRGGQRLVSKDGGLWRWDGFVASAEAVTPAAQRLTERNRLDDLTQELVQLTTVTEAARHELEGRSKTKSLAEQDEQRIRKQWQDTAHELTGTRNALVSEEREARSTNEKLAALKQARSGTETAIADARQRLETTRRDLDGLNANAEPQSLLEDTRADVTKKREHFTNARAESTGLERECSQRRQRMLAIEADQERWQTRGKSARVQLDTIAGRCNQTDGELHQLVDAPAEIEARKGRLMTETASAEKQRQAAADQLAEAETTIRAHEKALRDLQSALGSFREQKARCEARLESSRERRSEQIRQIREHFDCAPEQCLAAAGIAQDDTLPDAETVERQLQRLRADRERLGGVNLRAEDELEEIGTKFESMDTERADLEQAIAELRQGIIKLNKEGRRRLLEAFDSVNAHFQKLFKTLFDGGEAELKLIEADDPLESGLELIARPPGKKPTVLSLLSGGEQALTAMSLIFAVFLTNPSPICVLDEVDAPLDDANVDRFCRLVEEMAKTTNTRFLVITHHPMTMARMDRLFGVTMAEKGVSQLVSVDLATAESFRETG